MRALLIFLGFVATAAAQSSFDPNNFIDKKDLHKADVNQLWQTLGISEKIRETTIDGAKDTGKTFSCGGGRSLRGTIGRSYLAARRWCRL